MIDRDDILRNAGLRGHEEFDADDTCPKCKMTIAEMLRLGTIPPCEPAHERALGRAMTMPNDSYNDR